MLRRQPMRRVPTLIAKIGQTNNSDGVRLHDRMSPGSLALASFVMGGIATGSEFLLGTAYNKLTGKDWFKYHYSGKGKYTSLLSFPGYATLMGLSIYLTSKYLYSKGYKSIRDVQWWEWVQLGIGYSLITAAIEWVSGYVADQVLKKKWYTYPNSKLYYTSVPTAIFWGVGGVFFTMAGLVILDYLENTSMRNSVLIGKIYPHQFKY